MKNRITELFAQKKENILNIYFTAGFPKLGDTVRVLKALENAGVDMVEIGMPYSDPTADGPVIQNSSEKAIESGMTIPKLFEQLEGIREQVNIPIVLMGYINPVMQYGLENFCLLSDAMIILKHIHYESLKKFLLLFKYFFIQYYEANYVISDLFIQYI